jgi:hypothetical protein
LVRTYLRLSWYVHVCTSYHGTITMVPVALEQRHPATLSSAVKYTKLKNSSTRSSVGCRAGARNDCRLQSVSARLAVVALVSFFAATQRFVPPSSERSPLHSLTPSPTHTHSSNHSHVRPDCPLLRHGIRCCLRFYLSSRIRQQLHELLPPDATYDERGDQRVWERRRCKTGGSLATPTQTHTTHPAYGATTSIRSSQRRTILVGVRLVHEVTHFLL